MEMKEVLIKRYQCETCESKYKTPELALACEKKCNCPHDELGLLYGSALSDISIYLDCKKCGHNLKRKDFTDGNGIPERAKNIIGKIEKEKDPKEQKKLFKEI